MKAIPASNPRNIWIIGAIAGVLSIAHIVGIVIVIRTDVVFPKGYSISIASSTIVLIGLLFGLYWILNSELPQHRDTRIVGWFVTGSLAFLLINIGLMVTTPASRFRLITWLLWAATLGGGIGFLIGVFEARAISREVEAERGRIRQEELKRERDRLDQFASTISHDLRNPLTVATGRVSLAQKEFDSENLDIAEISLKRMEELVQDILTLARTGKDIDDRQAVAIDTLAESCWAGVDTATATIVTEIDRSVQADRSRLKQVFENLIRNAVEHAGEDVTITFGELEDGFYVEDDGPGIPEAKREQVFEMNHSSSETGTGFGLAIVKEIVTAHDWDIEVTEGADGGARFEITNVRFSDE